ncbi:hypothetical protein U3A55_10615 [Salarchaeum sp. III]
MTRDERDSSPPAGETRGQGPLEEIVDEIADAVGWDELFEDTDGN